MELGQPKSQNHTQHNTTGRHVHLLGIQMYRTVLGIQWVFFQQGKIFPKFAHIFRLCAICACAKFFKILDS